MIFHTLFFPSIQHYVNRQENVEIIEWVMIKYIHKCNVNTLKKALD